MVIDAEGNEVPMSALNVDKENEGQKEESVETEEKPKKTKKTTKENE
jgi:hypothetical protein